MNSGAEAESTVLKTQRGGADASYCSAEESIRSIFAASSTSVSDLPTHFITAQNCLTNLELPIPLPAATAKSTTLIRNHMLQHTLEISAKQSRDDWHDQLHENVLEAKQSKKDTAAERQTTAGEYSTVDAGLSANARGAAEGDQIGTNIPLAIAQSQTRQLQPQENTKAAYSTYTTATNTITASSAACTQSQNATTTTSVLLESAAIASDQKPLIAENTNSTAATVLRRLPSTTTVSSLVDEDAFSKSSDTSGDLASAAASSQELEPQGYRERSRNSTRLSERAKKKSWYNVLYPNYKSRSEDFKRLFKEVPSDERLIVDYSCALQRDILVQGRIYVSQNYICFHANIFRWETYACLRWQDVITITKEKTALVIPNAIAISTVAEKYFFSSFVSRDKTFLMLFRIWQDTLMNKPLLPQELWGYVHNCYGEELGLTTDDEDYIDPYSVPPTRKKSAEVESEFVSALEDNNLVQVNSACVIGISDCRAATGIGEIVGSDNSAGSAAHKQTVSFTSGGAKRNSNSNSSNSSGGSSVGAVKYIAKSNFFSAPRKQSASASGSDNKNSDTCSRSDGATNSQMKVTAKELTLESARPINVAASASGSNSVASKDGPKEQKVVNVRKVTATTKQRQPDETAAKNAEHSPTDTSDSSDSDENKMPFVATAECTSTHEGRQFMHTILPIHIDTLFNLLFSKSKFLVDFHENRKSTEMAFGEWIANEEGHKQRIVNVTVQLTASVGPKTSKVTEMQEMRECSKPGELYSIDINSVNAGIPYADSFNVVMHYCMVRTVDDHTMLSVHAQIKYKKSIWGVVKGFIEKNTWAGLEDFFTALLHALQSETCIPPAKGIRRRTRRGTASQIRPLEELPPSQLKTESMEHAIVSSAATPHRALGQRSHAAVSSAGSGKSKWLSGFVIFMLCFLILLNVILLFKLWKLEARIEDDVHQRARMPNLRTLKTLPNTHEDWIGLLRQQEELHETELRKWHVVLQTAIELLKKAEQTLAALLFH